MNDEDTEDRGFAMGPTEVRAFCLNRALDLHTAAAAMSAKEVVKTAGTFVKFMDGKGGDDE